MFNIKEVEIQVTIKVRKEEEETGPVTVKNLGDEVSKKFVIGELVVD